MDDTPHTAGKKKSRQNSDVSQLDVGMGVSPDSISSDRLDDPAQISPRPRSNSLGSTVRDDSSSGRPPSLSPTDSISLPQSKVSSPRNSSRISDRPRRTSIPFPISPSALTRQRSAPTRGGTQMPAIPPPRRARKAAPTGAAAL